MSNEWDEFYEKDLKDDKESAKLESMGYYEHLKVKKNCNECSNINICHLNYCIFDECD